MLSEIAMYVPTREEYSKADQDALFYSKVDYYTSRMSAKTISKESAKFGFSKHLEDSFTEKSKDAQENLNAWSSHGYTRRGLERWSNKDHGEKRQQEQFHAVMAVLRAQDDMIASREPFNHEQIRKVSYRASKTARHFARMMGKADSHALTLELKDDDESVRTALSHMTVSDDYSSTCSLSLKSALKKVQEPPPKEEEPENPVVDDLKTSSHDTDRGKQRRFMLGFGRKNRSGLDDSGHLPLKV